MRNIIILAALAITACTDAPNAKRVLEDQGYRNVEVGGYAFFSCDDRSDDFATSFTATSPSGARVSGAVCKGWLKGSTVRID